jgi:hypothetical protein
MMTKADTGDDKLTAKQAAAVDLLASGATVSETAAIGCDLSQPLLKMRRQAAAVKSADRSAHSKETHT